MWGLHGFIRVSQILCSLDMSRSELPKDERQQDKKRKDEHIGRAVYCQALFYP